jgi:hypothetical protein
MTVEEAGNYYLDWICWSNAWRARYGRAVGQGSTLGAWTSRKAHSAARTSSKVQRLVAQALDSPPAPWPDNVAEPISKVVNGLLGNVSEYADLASAKTTSDILAVTNRWAKQTNKSAQLVRLRLGLPAANTAAKSGCKGRGTKPSTSPASGASSTP